MKLKIIFTLLLLLFLPGVLALEAHVSNCADANTFANNCSYESVVFTSDISRSGDGAGARCISVSSDCPLRTGLTIDCDGHTITHTYTGTLNTNVFAFSPTAFKPIIPQGGTFTIQNCNIVFDYQGSLVGTAEIINLLVGSVTVNETAFYLEDNKFEILNFAPGTDLDQIRVVSTPPNIYDVIFDDNVFIGGNNILSIDADGTDGWDFTNNVYCADQAIDAIVVQGSLGTWSNDNNYCDDTAINDTGYPECTFSCSNYTSNLPECDDDIDNDGDGFIDYPDDSGCSNALDNSEDIPEFECIDPCEVNETFEYEDSVCEHGWWNGDGIDCIEIGDDGIFDCVNDAKMYSLAFDNIDSGRGLLNVQYDIRLNSAIGETFDQDLVVGYGTYSGGTTYAVANMFKNTEILNMGDLQDLGSYAYGTWYRVRHTVNLDTADYDFILDSNLTEEGVNFWHRTSPINFISFTPNSFASPFCNYSMDNLSIWTQLVGDEGDLDNESYCLDGDCTLDFDPNNPGFDFEQCRTGEPAPLCFFRVMFGGILGYFVDTITEGSNMILFIMFLIIVIIGGFFIYQARRT
jgi:hypothetical protein